MTEERMHPDEATHEQMVHLGQKWAWIFATGGVYLVLGVVALSLPVASTIGLTYALAFLLLVGGFMHLLHAFELRKRHGSTARFFQSALAIVTGVLISRYPGGGMLALSLALSFYFFIGSAAQWLLSSAMRPHHGSGWGMASAVMSFLLGLYILFTFPFSAVWVPGTLLGVDLVFSGAAMVAISLSLRSLHKKSGGMSTDSILRPSTAH